MKLVNAENYGDGDDAVSRAKAYLPNNKYSCCMAKGYCSRSPHER